MKQISLPKGAEQPLRLALGERLRSLRIGKGLTQKQVAEALGIERSTYTYYEVGRTLPGLPVFIQLVKLYKTSADYLLGIEPPEQGGPDSSTPNSQHTDTFKT